MAEKYWLLTKKSGILAGAILQSQYLFFVRRNILKRIVKKCATMRISPPDHEGNATVTVSAEERKEYKVDFQLEHRTAMRILFEMLYENQILEARERLYKH